MDFRFPNVPWSHCWRSDALSSPATGRRWGGIQLPRPLGFSLRSFTSDDARKKMQTFQEFFFQSSRIHSGWSSKEGRRCFLLICMFIHVLFWIYDVIFKCGLILDFLNCVKLISYLESDVGLAAGKASFIYLIFFQNLRTASHQI